MNEIKKVIDKLTITALETNIKIAAVAVLSDSGNIIYQTKNLSDSGNIIIINRLLNLDKRATYSFPNA